MKLSGLLCGLIFYGMRINVILGEPFYTNAEKNRLILRKKGPEYYNFVYPQMLKLIKILPGNVVE
jgi:hypothetical protein